MPHLGQLGRPDQMDRWGRPSTDPEYGIPPQDLRGGQPLAPRHGRRGHLGGLGRPEQVMSPQSDGQGSFERWEPPGGPFPDPTMAPRRQRRADRSRFAPETDPDSIIDLDPNDPERDSTMPVPDPNAPPRPRVTPGRGVTASHLFNGFDFTQDAANRDPNRSAKYHFADVVSEPALRDRRWMGLGENGRADMEAFANEFIVPDMEARGYTVHRVVGDRIEVSTREGRHWVDWVENAGTEGARLAWQAQTESGGWLHEGPGGGLEHGSTAPEEPDALPEPTDNGDGTVTMRMTPEAYRRLVARRERRAQRTIGDLSAPGLNHMEVR